MDQSIKSPAAWWIVLALIAASVEPIMVKVGYQKGASLWQMLAYRNLFAALAMVMVVGLTTYRKKSNESPLVYKDALYIWPTALLLMTTNGLVIYALAHVSTVWVITIMTTTPAFVAIVNQIKGRVDLGGRFWWGFGLCFLGVMFSVEVYKGGSVTAEFPIRGFIALALAVTSSTIYRTRMDDLTQRIKPYHVSLFIFLINAVVVSIFLIPWIPPISGRLLYLVAWTGGAAALANVAFLSAIRVLGSTRMSLFDMLQRPFVILCAALILEEPISWVQGLGVIMVMAGIHFAKVPRKKSPPFPAVSAAPSLSTPQPVP
jgi:drug/metabolite transporter (DMT)-like permease